MPFDAAYIIESIRNPTAKVSKGFPPVMVLTVQPTDAEIETLIAYIKTLK